MAKINYRTNPRVTQIFEDLEKFKNFCVSYGYRYDESSLYDMRNYSYQQYNKYSTNKNFRDQWDVDLRKMNSPVDN